MSDVTALERMQEILDDDDRRAIEALAEIYGDDADAILNALHSISTRVAILGGVSPELFMGGVKLHWDACVDYLNQQVN